MKKLPFEVVLSLVIGISVLGALLVERMIREHLTIMDVMLQFFIPTLIVGAIINFPVWWLYGRKPKDRSQQ